MTVTPYPERGGLGFAQASAVAGFPFKDGPYRAFMMVGPGTSSTLSTVAAGITFMGTINHPAIDATKPWRRANLTTGSTMGTRAYIRTTDVACRMTDGFRIVMRFGVDATCTGNRFFFGLAATTTNPTNLDPLTHTSYSRIGLGINASTGNWNLVHGVATIPPVVVDLGVDYPVNTTDILQLVLEPTRDGSGVDYEVTNVSTGKKVSGTLTDNIPALTDFCAPLMVGCNNAQSAEAIFAIYRLTVETPY